MLRRFPRPVVWLTLASAAALLSPAGGCSCGAGNEGTGGDAAAGPAGPGATTGSQGGSMGTFASGSSTSSGVGDPCHVSDDLDALPPCEVKAPADAFDPVVQWTFTDPNGSGSLVTPLVGNFTDDDQNGEINLCDVPDVLVVAYTGGIGDAAIYVLSGDDGSLITTMNGVVDGNINHAFGDIDGDGLPEVVSATPQGNVIAFEHDGALKWTGALGSWPTLGNWSGSGNLGAYCHAFAIYDLDADGSPEILGGFDVFSNEGQLKWSATGSLNGIPGEPFWCPTPTAADLDGDGMLEVIYGHAAYRHDGTVFWQVGGNPGHPHVANLDDDPEPEVLVNTDQGISLINHDGTVKFANLRPTGEGASARCWGKPGVIHDFNGDGKADLATGTCSNYSVYAVGAASLTANWTQPVSDTSGLATGTAFDFLGDGVADAIYADENTAYVYEGATGMLELSVPRSSGTLIEYPVVADIDNDGSAEFLVVSNQTGGGVATITAYRDAMDRWTPARRVWNQHAYHVTNVREDGTIPQNMKKSWQLLNTFRTNSQVEAGGNCEPPTPQ